MHAHLIVWLVVQRVQINLCEGNAITFPDIANVKKIYKEKKIWSKVKKKLKEEGKLETEE